MRINKYLASLGVASRRKVDEMIEEGKVRVGGRAAKLGEKIDPIRDKVTVGGREVGSTPNRVYFAVNKPKGIVSTVADTDGRRTVVSLVKSKERLFPVGRLDMESEGLMLLTNDGELMQRMTHPKYHVLKVYEVVVLGSVPDDKIGRMRSGMKLRGGDFTAKAKVDVVSRDEHKTILMVTLGEGKNRQIRRMCEALHLHLLNLKRVEFGPLKLDGLVAGRFRALESGEINELYRVAGLVQNS
ncbi:MAG: pseudouridine synthase [Candidatus Curtissbacteria bacterium]|nr:pseudouridine synthase [Candidatus Curtissbacteria bacterium]